MQRWGRGRGRGRRRRRQRDRGTRIEGTRTYTEEEEFLGCLEEREFAEGALWSYVASNYIYSRS